MVNPAVGLLAVLLAATTALAQDLPSFFKDTMPDRVARDYVGAYAKLKTGEGVALDPKTQELIGLAVAAQIPCEYCVYAHLKGARQAGASEEELREAVLIAGAVRLFSTQFYGMALDLDAFRAEHDLVSPPGGERDEAKLPKSN